MAVPAGVNGDHGPTRLEKSFAASLDIVKLFTTLSSGGLAFSIGLTTQSTNNYPGWYRYAIIGGWFVFFVSIAAGLWAQMLAITLIKDGNADPNEAEYRAFAFTNVGTFLVGVIVLGSVLVGTAPHGAPGEKLAVATPAQAIAVALHVANGTRVAKIAATEYVKGVDPASVEQASWHVALETIPPGTLDVYVDPLTGCAYVVQRVARGTNGCATP